MTNERLRIAFWTITLLVALLVFNEYRWSLVRDCQRRGGVWDGPDSKCRLIPALNFEDKSPAKT